MNSSVFRALNRAKEPSIWASLAGLAVVFAIAAEHWSMIGPAVAGVAAAIAIYQADRAELYPGF